MDVFLELFPDKLICMRSMVMMSAILPGTRSGGIRKLIHDTATRIPVGWGEIYQIGIRNLSGFCYLCQQLTYFVFSRIFLIASKITEEFSGISSQWAS
jgi:hypothetical protein